MSEICEVTICLKLVESTSISGQNFLIFMLNEFSHCGKIVLLNLELFEDEPFAKFAIVLKSCNFQKMFVELSTEFY